MFKRIRSLASILCILIALASFVSCSKSKGAVQEIYFLNFKPESADTYKKIAADYEKEKGVKVKVVTAAANTYEQTLKSEIAKSEPPTIFQVNGAVGYESWKDYCADLKDSKLYSYLTEKELAITDNGGVYGIPYVVEGYGIICNKAIMDKYFSLDNKKTKVKSLDEITDFATLKAVVEDMSKNLDKLGISGVFGSTSLASGQDWRWQTHLSNIPFYYEFKDKNKDADPVATALNAKEIEFTYAKNFQNIFDLYTNNSVTEKKLLGSKSVADSMAEFALGRCAMIQNGTWSWSQISDVPGNKVKAEDIAMLPIYTGVEGEKTQGLCIGTENYFAINVKADEEKQKASLEFLDWLFSSEKGKKYVVEELKFITPFNTFASDEAPADPLSKEVKRYMDREEINTIPWIFTGYPSDVFKTNFGNALLEYVQGSKKYDEVVSTVKKSWKEERK